LNDSGTEPTANLFCCGVWTRSSDDPAIFRVNFVSQKLMNTVLIILGLTALIIVVIAVAVFYSAVQDLKAADEYKCPVDSSNK